MSPGEPAGGLPGAPTDFEADPIPAALRDRRIAVVAALAASLLALVVAVALASGSVGGDITVDAANGGPLGSGADGSRASRAGEIVVDVAGAVLRPGVYRLAPGARVGDAIAAAGGYSPRVAAGLVGRSLNLAAVVHDGDLIVVPSRDDVPTSSSPAAGGTGGAGGAASGRLVDLNHASAEQLDALPGIGPVTAAKIIASRTETPFRSVDELLQRKLVGQKTFDQIKPLVTVAG